MILRTRVFSISVGIKTGWETRSEGRPNTSSVFSYLETHTFYVTVPEVTLLLKVKFYE